MSVLRVAISQSNYLPWKGYFDIIHDVDLFIFYDDVQYTTRDWRSRNRVKRAGGTQWITVPVSGSRRQLIHDVKIADPRFAGKHYRTLRQSYGRTRYFERYREFLDKTFVDTSWRSLSELNQRTIRDIARLLGIEAQFADSRQYRARGAKTDRLLDILGKVGATSYVSGPAAAGYLDEPRFGDAGIELVYKDYSGYPEYDQIHPPFDHQVTVLDLLFHTGPDAPHYIWGWREESAV